MEQECHNQPTPTERIPPLEPVMRKVITGVAIYAFVGVSAVRRHHARNSSTGAKAGCGWNDAGLVVLVWCIIGGTLALLYKDRVRGINTQASGESWQLKFVIFATIMCLPRRSLHCYYDEYGAIVWCENR